VQCPKVSLEARRNNNVFRATVSTRNATRFRLHVPERLRVFSDVRELCEQWPLTVEALKDHEPPLRPTQALRPPVEFVKVSCNVSSSSSSSSSRSSLAAAATTTTTTSVHFAKKIVEVVGNATKALQHLSTPA